MSLCISGRSSVQTNPRNHKVNAHVPLLINYHHAVQFQHFKQQVMEMSGLTYNQNTEEKLEEF